MKITGITETIRTIQNFQAKTERKIDNFLKRLADEGVELVRMNLGPHTSSGATISSVRAYEHGDGYRIVVESEGILFLEFGTGVTYSVPEHPKAAELGYGAGSHGPQGSTGKPWVYQDQYGNFWTTYGQPASMPVYRGARELEQRVMQIAREVFK